MHLSDVALDEVDDVGFPGLGLNPLRQPLFKFIEQQKPVFGRLADELCLGEPRTGVDQIRRFVACSTLRAFIAPRLLIATAWTGPDHIAVGEKFVVSFREELIGNPLFNVAIVQEFQEKLMDRSAMVFCGRARIMIERDVQFGKESRLTS